LIEAEGDSSHADSTERRYRLHVAYCLPLYQGGVAVGPRERRRVRRRETPTGLRGQAEGDIMRKKRGRRKEGIWKY
jgi:hypothetical protein